MKRFIFGQINTVGQSTLLVIAVHLGTAHLWYAVACGVVMLIWTYVEGFMRGHRRGYDYARSLAGAYRVPPYDKLHEELP